MGDGRFGLESERLCAGSAETAMISGDCEEPGSPDDAIPRSPPPAIGGDGIADRDELISDCDED